MNKEAIQLHQQGVELQQRGALREAAEAYQAALALDPRLELTRSNLAMAHYQLGEIEQAIFHYKQLLADHPLNVKARYNLGVVYASIGRYEQAIGEYRQVLHHEAGHAMALNNLAWILGQQQRYGEAIAALERLLEINPGDTAVLFQLGQLHKLTGNPAQAETYWRTVATVDPRHVQALLAMAEAARQRQDWHGTLKWALEALGADANHPAAQIMAARAHMHLMEYQQATDLLMALGRKHPNLAEVRFHLGSLHHTLDRLPEARHHLAEAVRLGDNTHFEYHNEYGTVLYRLGEYDDAAEQFREAEGLAPDNAVIKANLGFTYMMLGERDAAGQYFEAFMSNPEASEAVRLSVRCALDLL
ncbi:MAG: Tetratricopeptide 2 repeat protein [Cyanobacteria bacterium RYN_339]|nr:Tetratricopeptide 2 repeat protein [Cyanobacteria bacterium RYN_339]